MEEGIFPMVNYISNVSIADIVKLKKENDAIQTQIDQMFPEITHNNKCIFYTAHDQIPTSQSMLKVYAFIQKLK